MLQTLFYIPQTIGDLPFLGFGLLLGIWCAVAGLYLVVKFLRDGWNDDFQAGLLYSGVIAAVIAWGLPMISEARGIPVRGYGLMMLIAVTSSVALAIYRARQVGLADDVIYSLAMWMILPGIIGARIFFVIEYRERFFAPGMSLGESLVKAISLQEGGLVVFGSLIGAVLGLLAFTRFYRMPLLPLIDVSVPSMALGQAIGRIGCFFNGCCFGGECDLPWQVTFPPESPPYHQQLEKGKLHLDGLAWQSLKKEDALLIENVHPNSAAEKLGFARGQHLVKLRLLTSTDDEVQSLPYTSKNGVQYSLAGDIAALLNQPNRA
jgi:phosphatidylglycerol:prolipoprotein diacylglycerol transferase